MGTVHSINDWYVTENNGHNFRWITIESRINNFSFFTHIDQQSADLEKVRETAQIMAASHKLLEAAETAYAAILNGSQEAKEVAKAELLAAIKQARS